MRVEHKGDVEDRVPAGPVNRVLTRGRMGRAVQAPPENHKLPVPEKSYHGKRLAVSHRH